MTVVDPAGVSVYETHIGVVFLIGDRAVKLKKPVRTDFLDFSTRVSTDRGEVETLAAAAHLVAPERVAEVAR